jgi:hypothetical protein
MELQVLKDALNENLNEQQVTNKQIEDLAREVKDSNQKIDGFSQKLDNQKIVAPAPDTGPILAILTDFQGRITRIVADQPKTVVHQRRLLLFPETNAGQYYKIVFGRLIPWGFAFIATAFVFTLCREYLQTSSQIGERRYYYEVYLDAWNRLDTTLGPAGRKKMQEALQRAVNDQAK